MSRFLLGTVTGAALATFAFASGFAPSGSSAVAQSATTDVSRPVDLFGKVFDIVRDHYVDKPDADAMVKSAINGMLSGLDPHSSYMSAKAYRDMREDTRGEFGGLGMTVSMEDGAVKVVSPIYDTPASRAGILAGDIISQVDGESTKDLTLSQVVEKLRGPVGTSVRIEIVRKGQSAPIPVALTRATIKVSTVRSRVEDGDVGYIRITQFNGLATDELKSAVKSLSAQIPQNELKGYILDLRNNPGGLLNQAVSVSDAFLTGGEIVSTRSRIAEEAQRFDATAGDITDGKPLIVLINGGSASASEIVAGALQDQKRATVVGSQSFGKGSVQTIIPLGSGNGALRLTTARYFTPSGRSIQAQGITPDIQVLQEPPKSADGSAAASKTSSEAGLKGHLKAEGDEKQGSQAFVPADAKQDKALQFALGLFHGVEHNAAFPASIQQATGP
jgi:carboxyl-terminal processing protease